MTDEGHLNVAIGAPALGPTRAVMVVFRVRARTDKIAGEAVHAALAEADLPFEYIVSMGPA